MPPEVQEQLRKQVILLRYRGRDENRGRRRHISPRPVRSVSKLQPVESRLKEGLSTDKHGEQAHRRLKYVDRPIRLPSKNRSHTVRRDEYQPLAIQVNVVCPCRLCGLLAWLRLPTEWGDPSQVSNVIYVRHGANGAPCHEKIRRDINHRGEALGGKLAQADKETALCGVNVNVDGEE